MTRAQFVAKALVAVCLLAGAAHQAHSLVIGVDMGTEFMKVALVKPGRPFEIVLNDFSKRKTTVAVGFDPSGERLYGKNALGLFTKKPHLFYGQLRRMLGRNASHPVVADALRQAFNAQDVATDPSRGTLVFRHATTKTDADKGDDSGSDDAAAAAADGDASADAAAATDAAADDSDAEAEAKLDSYTVEELTAMMLKYAQNLGELTAEGKIRDCVITVPSFWTQYERQAMLDAAKITGMNVLSLLDENTAAATQYGIDRVFENSTHRALFYNMGAGATQVSLVYYDARVKKRMGKNQTVGQFEVKAKAWDQTLGGLAFEERLVQLLADKFDEKHAKGDKPSIRTSLRAMAKLKKAAEKGKRVLSANKENHIHIGSLFNDIDFRYKVTRPQFEELCADLIARVTAPIDTVLASAGITAADLDTVEILGGGVRVPAVGRALKEHLGLEQLGAHLNGDEAMALGAAFHGANLSTAFRVRHVGLTDVTPYPVGVRLRELGPREPLAAELEAQAMAEAAGVEGDAADAEAETAEAAEAADAADADADAEEAADGKKKKKKAWTKRATLFKRFNRLGSRKVVSFHHDRDIQCVFNHEKSGGAALPASTARAISAYNITGITVAANNLFELRARNLTTERPKVQLSFMLLPNGLVDIVKGEATFVEVIPPPPVVEEEDDEADLDAAIAEEDAADADAAADANATATDADADAAADDAEGDADAEKADGEGEEEAAADADADAEKAEGDAAEGDDEKKEEEGDGKEADAEAEEEAEKPKPKPKKKKKEPKATKKVHRFPLKWERVDASATPDVVVEEGDDEAEPAALTMDNAPYGVYPRVMKGKTIKRGSRKLKALDKADRKRLARQEAKNELEGFVLRSRSQIREYQEDLEKHVASEDALQQILDDLEAVEDWLYEDGENASLKAYKKKRKETAAPVHALFFKLRETQERPVAVQEARLLLTATRGKVGNWTRERPQLTDEEKAEVLALVDAAEAWLTEKEAALEAQDLREPETEPAFTSQDVRTQLEPLQALVVRLQRKPKPPAPEPVVDAEELEKELEKEIEKKKKKAAKKAAKAAAEAEAADEDADDAEEADDAEADADADADAEADADADADAADDAAEEGDAAAEEDGDHDEL